MRKLTVRFETENPEFGLQSQKKLVNMNAKKNRAINDLWTWFKVLWGSKELKESIQNNIVPLRHNLEALGMILHMSLRNVVFCNI